MGDGMTIAASGIAPAQDPLDAPFDQYQRYAIAAAIARAMAGNGPDARPPRLLDVGGHHLDLWFRPRRPIAEFLPEAPSVTIDLARSRLAGYLCARGDALPFPTGAFDLVCSVDVLEHVPPPARETVLAQTRRVGRRAVIVAAPFRSAALARGEALVSDFVRAHCGYEQGQLQEHREHGWPDLDATAASFAAAGWGVRVFGYGSLWRWVLMMIDKHAVSALGGSRLVQAAMDRAFNETRFAIDRDPPCYRHFVVATATPDDPLLAHVETAYGAVTPAALAARPGPDPAALDQMFAQLELHAANQRIQHRLEPRREAAHVAEVELRRDHALASLDAVTREATRLERLLRDVERSPAFRLGQWARRVMGRS
jgi:O-antigen biosynthesis protein